jgi:penicillin-binding protein 1A
MLRRLHGRDPRTPARPSGRWARIAAALRPTPRKVLVATIAVVILIWLLWQRCGLLGCPDVATLASYEPGGASVLLDRAGHAFGDLAPMHHAVVPLESVPEYVPAAFVAVEDKRFFRHHGVDWRRALGAARADVRARGFAQGFSTITMQLARNVWHDRLPGEQRTPRRKILEIRVARDIERHFTKRQILALYLNQINFGEGAFGIEAAARTYFGRSARRLTLAQAATLAGVPRSPVLYDPRRNPERARARRDLILQMMAAQHRVSAADAERAARSRLAVIDEPPRPARGPAAIAPYFVDEVRRALEGQLGNDIYAAPLRVITTLDRDAQQAAEAELRRQLRAIEDGEFGAFHGQRFPGERRDSVPAGNYLQGTVVLLDADSGDVLALVGGRDYAQSPFDRATRAVRQPGSAFKPFVFAAALADGYAPSQHIADTPLRMELPGGEVWEPRNFSGKFEGEVTLREALVRSLNVPTIRLGAAVGVRNVARLAARAGVHSRIPDVPSVAIGAAVVTPMELTAAYTAFADAGKAVAPRYVLRVEDADGNVVWQPGIDRRDVMAPGVAYLVTDMLGDAVNEGTGTAVRDAGVRGPVAGKTGTTNDGTDVWFVGYTPRLVGSVWIGFDQRQPIVRDATGGTLAAPVWGRVMRRVLLGRARGDDWAEPGSVVTEQVDPATGLVLRAGCRPAHGAAEPELFLRDMKPAASCPKGQPRAGSGFFDRALAWIGDAWATARDWVTGLFGRRPPAPPPPRPNDRFLGAPRLPPEGQPPTEIEVPDFRPQPVVPEVMPPEASPRPAPDSMAPRSDSAPPMPTEPDTSG